MAGTRARQREATAESVLEAARAEFEAAGYEAASVRSIAVRAGVSAGTVLHHFGGKQELLNAALFADLEEAIARAVSKSGDGPIEERLGRIADGVFRYYRRRPGLSRTLLKEALFAEGAWAERFREQVAGVHGAIARLVAEAKDRGELRREADAALFGVAWFSFFYFALIAWANGAHAKPVALVDRLVRQHLAGLRPEPSRTPRSTR